ncbi:MAG: ATP-binding protein [Paracoccaceae bacterium]|nr:ATP-binding protein [Paracoccaceae bacterium]
MTIDELLKFIDCAGALNGDYRVRARERRNLEFKVDMDANCVAKSLKTIAAFSSSGGGSIVFGVRDRPRELVGVNNQMDEADVQNQLFAHLYPVPDIELHQFDVGGRAIICLIVFPVIRKPVIAIKDKQTAAQQNQTVLRAGTVYFRRAGQTKPITGEEFASILEKRDERVRSDILNFIMRGKDIGFERAVVADFRRAGPEDNRPTLYVPENEAHRLNIVDRAKLIESEGAPAYQISGTVELTIPSEKDPRKPMLPEKAARVLRPRIREKFGDAFPWTSQHLRKAATQLGFWDDPKGDRVHTGHIEVNGSPVYFEQGRAAIERFANRTTSEFVEAVGSKETIQSWNAVYDQQG